MFRHLIFLIVFCNLPLLSISQNQPPFNAEKEIVRIDLKLQKFRNQHQQGTFATAFGLGIATIPSIALGKTNVFTVALGTFITAIGVATTLNSYKYLSLKYKESDGK